MANLPDKPWFRIGEAAKLLGVHENTIRNWIGKGYLTPHIDPSGHQRVTRESLKDCLQDAPIST